MIKGMWTDNTRNAKIEVVLAYWKVKTPCHANGVFIKKMLSLNRKKITFISKRHYLLAHYIVTFRNSRSILVTHKNASCASQSIGACRNIPRQSLHHKQVSASGFPRHPLLSNVYVIEITTPRVTRTRNIIRGTLVTL